MSEKKRGIWRRPQQLLFRAVEGTNRTASVKREFDGRSRRPFTNGDWESMLSGPMDKPGRGTMQVAQPVGPTKCKYIAIRPFKTSINQRRNNQIQRHAIHVHMIMFYQVLRSCRRLPIVIA